MRSMILAALALVVLFAVSGGSTQELIRLCGSEFRRALIHQCGASRWRRGFGSDAALRALLGRDQETLFMDNSDPSAKLTLADEENLSNKPGQREATLEAFQTPARVRRQDLSKLADLCCNRGCNKGHLNDIC
ncbi:insulin-like 5a [Chiloscyllium plagiosum]|uniref:insulin-like 5a n=1 Tax=Chiloscyllium plagiosum TaxID=36176 RepID=UPI001CB83FA8|nr:insulin-like 5a [Chiloscyllium plagiosum]